MTEASNEWAALATVAMLVVYELAVVWAQLRQPMRLARSAHAALRADWMAAVSAQPGSEVLALQTLRNALMSASLTASTAVLGLMGAVSLIAPSLQAVFGESSPLAGHISIRLALELLMVTLLCTSFVANAMAVRFYNHAGFIAGMPVGSDARLRWAAVGVVHIRRAGMCYSWGLRHMILVAPVLAAIAYPLAGLVVGALVVTLLYAFDRINDI